MPKRERITSREIERDIIENVGETGRETEAQYKKSRKWKILDTVILIALVAMLIFYPKQTAVFLFVIAVSFPLFVFVLLLIKRRKKKSVRIENYNIGEDVLEYVIEEQYEKIHYHKGHKHVIEVKNYMLHFENGGRFLIPRRNYDWSRENPMSDEFICKNSNKGERFIVVTERATGKIAAVYHKDYFEYKENHY